MQIKVKYDIPCMTCDKMHRLCLGWYTQTDCVTYACHSKCVTRVPVSASHWSLQPVGLEGHAARQALVAICSVPSVQCVLQLSLSCHDRKP